MANKFPLILNTSANQIQEIASGDNLDLTGCKIVGLDGINSGGIVTFTKAHVGAATTWGEDLVVTGNARVTGILTVGTNSVTISGNDVNITGVTTASNFKTGTSNLHNVGLEIAGINVLGADTPIGTGATIYNSGAAVFTGIVTATNYVGTINTPAQPNITSVGTLSSLDVSGNVSIGGTLTYEDVTNIDAVGLITARNGVSVTSGGIKVLAGVSNFNANIVGTATTAISITAADESSDTSCNILFATAATGNVAPKTGTNLTFNSSSGALTATSFSGVIAGTTASFSGDATFNGGAGAVTIPANSDIRFANGTWSGDYGGKIQVHDNHLFLQGGSGGVNIRNAAGNRQLTMTTDGHFGPDNSQSYNLGFSDKRWANIYGVAGSFTGDVNTGPVLTATGTEGISASLYLIADDGDDNGDGWRINSNQDANDLTISNNISGSYVDKLTLTHGGAVTATSFSGSGASLTSLNASNLGSGTVPTARLGSGTASNSVFLRGDSTWATVTQTTINSNADNRIITGSGTANTLNAESSFTFGGSSLNVTNGSGDLTQTLSATGDVTIELKADSDDSGSEDHNPTIKFWQDNTQNCLNIGISGVTPTFTGATHNVPYIHVTNAHGGSIGLEFATNNVRRLEIDSVGHTKPAADNTYNLGSSTKRWANIYSADLQLSNEGKTNDVDGTWGNYTIQEGESDLFLINNRSGKKYKFNLTEVN